MNNANLPKALQDARAADLMSNYVISVNLRDSMHDVAKVFVENNISAAPVVDYLGEPVGVITKTDLARFGFEQEEGGTVLKERRVRRDGVEEEPRRGVHIEHDQEPIERWMTPLVFDVYPNSSLIEVVKKMYTLGIHHLFVRRKDSNQLVGVITTFDILGFLYRSMK